MAFSTDIGIDLGTASILVYVRGKGIVLNEPAVVAIEQQMEKVLAVGAAAQKMLGRTPGNIVAVRPLREGVIADFDITEVMLKHYLAMAIEKRRLLRPRVVAVSYTHLDVYKRQPLYRPLLDLRARRQDYRPGRLDHPAAHPDPVSYTHLDVYKRQSLNCAGIGLQSRFTRRPRDSGRGSLFIIPVFR